MKNNDSVSNIPVPSELPLKPDLSNIPDNVLRSGAVESLINQNDDLMARLTVSLRRIAGLEDRLSQYDRVNEKIKFHYENLKDQVILLREKSETLKQRKKQAEAQATAFKEKTRALEIQYARDYTNSKENIETLNKSIENLGNRVKRYIKYRTKIQKLTGKIKNELKQTLRELDIQRTRTTTTNEKLQESVEYIQKRGGEHKFELDELTNAYEDQIRQIEQINLEERCSLETKIEQLSTDCSELRSKATDYEQIYKRMTELENEVIFLKRRRDEIDNQNHQDIEKGRQDTQHYRGEYRKARAEADHLIEENRRLGLELKKTADAKEQALLQLDTSSSISRESQQRIEELEKKNQALQQLNKQLSISLNDSKSNVDGLKQQLDRTYMEAKGALSKARALTPSESDTQEATTQQNLVSNVDRLIAEIQSGFSRK